MTRFAWVRGCGGDQRVVLPGGRASGRQMAISEGASLEPTVALGKGGLEVAKTVRWIGCEVRAAFACAFFFVSRMTEQWFIIRDREAERVQVELLHAGLAKVLSFRWSVKTRVDDCAVQAVRGEMVL